MTPHQEWQLCLTPQVKDTLKWNEPIWAAPNKPRGKRDKIGEQEIIALLISIKDVLELKVISVKNLSSGTQYKQPHTKFVTAQMLEKNLF